MASMAASADDDDMRSEAPSTCGHWTASDDEDEEEEVVVVGDVATILPNENVNKIDVCESGVGHVYETEKVEEHETIEVESKAVDNGIAYEIEVEYEEMPQAPEAQDVVVPPSGDSVESVCANICKDMNELMDKLESKPVDESKSVNAISSSSETPGSSTVTGTTLRKSSRHGKKRMQPDDPSDALEIIGQRATILQKFGKGTDFLVKKKHERTLKNNIWWVHEDELRDSDAGCEAMEVFDNKHRRK